jgi:Polysaccharide lyase
MILARAHLPSLAKPSRRPRGRSRRACLAAATLTLAAASALVGCEPKLVVGDWCVPSDAGTPATTDPIASPWSTGFENGFCDFTQAAGFCLADTHASYRLVTSPVHTGQFAAAFDLDTSASGYQARCVRQGALPSAAYYGAWYYVPAAATNPANWNLLHFQGGSPSGQHNLWDVSLKAASNGDLQLTVFDSLNNTTRSASSPMAIPIGVWFHLEFYVKRAADTTGEIALYQDGQMLLDVTGIATDDSDYGQWYVGDLAAGLTPPNFTLYVDDVTIGPTL